MDRAGRVLEGAAHTVNGWLPNKHTEPRVNECEALSNGRLAFCLWRGRVLSDARAHSRVLMIKSTWIRGGTVE